MLQSQRNKETLSILAKLRNQKAPARSQVQEMLPPGSLMSESEEEPTMSDEELDEAGTILKPQSALAKLAPKPRARK